MSLTEPLRLYYEFLSALEETFPDYFHDGAKDWQDLLERLMKVSEKKRAKQNVNLTLTLKNYFIKNMDAISSKNDSMLTGAIRAGASAKLDPAIFFRVCENGETKDTLWYYLTTISASLGIGTEEFLREEERQKNAGNGGMFAGLKLPGPMESMVGKLMSNGRFDKIASAVENDIMKLGEKDALGDNGEPNAANITNLAMKLLRSGSMTSKILKDANLGIPLPSEDDQNKIAPQMVDILEKTDIIGKTRSMDPSTALDIGSVLNNLGVDPSELNDMP